MAADNADLIQIIKTALEQMWELDIPPATSGLVLCVAGLKELSDETNEVQALEAYNEIMKLAVAGIQQQPSFIRH